MEKSEMTLIKVPGKNKRDQRRAVAIENRNTNIKPIRRMGRPLKVPKHSPQSKGFSKNHIKTQGQRSLKNLKSRRKMAALEKLPAELISKVFLFAMNLELPRASPIIAGKLSSQHAYVETIIRIFDPTWEHSYELITNDAPILVRVPGDPELQTSILRCRCTTLQALRKAEEKWLNYATSRDPNQKVSLHDVDGNSSKWNLNGICDSFVDDFDQFADFSKDYREDDRPFNLNPPWPWSATLKIHPDVDIPESLLMGPWTEDMIEHLFWLVRAGARIRWMESTTGEVAVIGLKSAIGSGNLKVLYILHFLGLAEHVTIDLLIWALYSAGDNKVDVNTRLMSMFISRQHPEYNLERFTVTGQLRKMKMMAKVKENSGQEDVREELTCLAMLENRWNVAT